MRRRMYTQCGWNHMRGQKKKNYEREMGNVTTGNRTQSNGKSGKNESPASVMCVHCMYHTIKIIIIAVECML